MIYGLAKHSISTTMAHNYDEIETRITISYPDTRDTLEAVIRYNGETFTADNNGIEIAIFTIIARLEEGSAEIAHRIKTAIIERWQKEQDTVYEIDFSFKEGMTSLRFMKGIHDNKARILASVGSAEYEITCGQNRVWFPRDFPYTKGTVYRQIVTLGRAHWHEQTYHNDID